MTVLRTVVRYVGWALSRIWLVVGLLVLWEFLTRSREDPFFPPPSEILTVLREIWFSGPAHHLEFRRRLEDLRGTATTTVRDDQQRPPHS